MLNNRKRIFDDLLQMRSNSTMATGSTGAAASVDGALKIFDTGGGYTEGKLVVDVDYASMASPSNVKTLAYIIELQGSNSASFATPIVKLEVLKLTSNCNAGTADGIPMTPSAAAGAAGRSLALVPFRVIKPFQNDVNGTVYRYLRLWSKTAGTVVTGMDYAAYLSI